MNNIFNITNTNILLPIITKKTILNNKQFIIR
jgi:hypothetical protein